ncbi:MAG TPA: hypothetical protein VGF67_28970 [Ktedonobacteraceae bacterium]
MDARSQLEAAATRMKLLVESDLVNTLRAENEATVRLRIVDEVLSILGWQKHEYGLERVTSTGGYTDYRLSIENQTRLIVEAKRIGIMQPFLKAVRQPQYTNFFLYHRCGSEMKALFDQCLAYCAQCGVPYAIATTGEIWMIFLGFKYGTEWGKLRAFVFHSLEDISERFHDFYGLISRDAVKNNSLEEKFASMVLIKPNITVHPREQLEQASSLGQTPHRQVIRAFFDQFMGDITRPGQEKMLEQCYVENYELNEFSRELQQILQYDAMLDEAEDTIDEIDKTVLEKELEYQSYSRNPKTILLVGNVGAGKSTFIHRFSRYEAQPDRNVCTIVDLIDHATKKIEPTRAEEQHLARLALERLASEFRGKMNPYSSDVQRGCFEVELNRFKTQRQVLFKQDPASYALKEEEHILFLNQNHYKHLTGYLKYIRKKRYRVWLAFDNVDRGSESYQAFIYAFAHQLSADTGCVTLITLRQDTFLEAQEAGFLDVRSSDIVFQLKSPEFRQVVSRRRKFIEHMIERNEVSRPFKDATDLIGVLNWHLTRLVLTEDDFVRLLITTFSLNNVRYGLQMLRDYYTSSHSTFHEFYQNHPYPDSIDEATTLHYEQEANRLLQALMLGNSWNYQETRSEISNAFWVSPLEKMSHFLMLRVLAYLSIQRDVTSPRISTRYDRMCNDFISLGYQRHHINNVIRKLLYAGLIVSPTLPDNPVAEVKMDIPDPLPRDMKIAITGRGHYYLKKLASHKYYQARVGEDTVWYNEQLANEYMKCLQETLPEQRSGSDDTLLATNAREIFLRYLAKSLLEESQSYIRFTSEDWAQLMNDLVERSIFGKTITKPFYVTEAEALDMLKELLQEALFGNDKVQIEIKNIKSEER